MTNYIGNRPANVPISASDVPNLPTSKITSGTFADARISNSSVSQFASTFDDNKIVNDISTLGLRVHTQENLNASNTNYASFDVFQDSSGITNLTNCQRNASEYMSAVSISAESGGTTGDFDDITWGYPGSALTQGATTLAIGHNSYNSTFEQRSNFLSGNYWWSFKVDHSTMQSFSANASETTPGQFAFTIGIRDNENNVSSVSDSIYNNNSSTHYYLNFAEVDNSETVYFLRDQTSQGSATVDLIGNYITFLRDTASSGSLKVYLSSTSNDYAQGTLLHTFSGYSNTSTNKIIVGQGHNQGVSFTGQTFVQNSSYKDGISSLSSLTASATGSFENNAITVSSTSSMGAVITYQDQAGTNALNTDIILKLSADNGSNYSTATLTALPDFATGIKMAKVNDLSVTAGTQLKYKLEFANQSSGSKEARIRGVSLQY